MGYTTDFSGSLQLSRPLTDTERNYINNFSGSRRMSRDVNKLMALYGGKHGHPTPKDNTPEGIYGKEGEYFVMPGDNFGQDRDESIIDYNTPPGQRVDSKQRVDSNLDFLKKWFEIKGRIDAGECQPGLWCQWVIEGDETGQELVWDGGEKFYEYDKWLKYLIDNFFEPWGVKLNGSIKWQGEEMGDRGKLIVKNNVLDVII